jgi:hypothetical protein
MFILVNWIEIIGFAVLFWLIRNIKNELNVKREIQLALIFFSLFSIIYFIVQLNFIKAEKDEQKNIFRYVIVIAIELRNLSTLFITTAFSLYMAFRHPEKTYPKTIEGKYEAFDFDLVLTSPLCFQYFYDFIEKNSSFNLPYLDLYVHSKLYQELIDQMMACDFSSGSF